MEKRILILNGPNLNRTGLREQMVYGEETLAAINESVLEYGVKKGLTIAFYQSNGEGELIDAIHRVAEEFDGCVFNAGAYAHYSYGLRDAIASISEPVVEVHMSNIYKREPFRHTSVISDVCAGQISGFGKQVYTLALEALEQMI